MNKSLFYSKYQPELVAITEHIKGASVYGSNLIQILNAYCERHRYYHTLTHIANIFDQIRVAGINDSKLLVAALLHDVVYIPGAEDNELQSAKFYREIAREFDLEIYNAIVDTKSHTPRSNLSRLLCNFDSSVVRASMSEQFQWDLQIFKEYQKYPYEIYKEKRLIFLKHAQAKWNCNLEHLIAWNESWQPNVALFPGSFNPWHKGHQNILEKAEKIFDKVIVCSGKNPDKNKDDEKVFQNLTEKLPFHEVIEFSGLLFSFLESYKMPLTLVRGIRNAKDFEYENLQIKISEQVSTFRPKTVFIACDTAFEYISSSAVKTLNGLQESLGDKLC